MQTTSQTWKDLWAAGNAWLETKAVINGTDYTEISNPVINRALMQNGCSIGNAVSATCQFSVRTSAAIPKSATVVIKMRLTDGTTTSEWLSAGTFYISHRQRDPVTGVLTLECYDAMLKANAQMPELMPWTTAGGTVMTTQSGEWLYLSAHYPRKMADVLNDISLITGLAIDPATQIETGDDYIIGANDVGGGATINHILCKIAAANGGNWIITPDNMLKLVPLTSAVDAASATVNVVDVDGITGGIDTSNTGTITGIRYSVDNVDHVVGDETGIVIDADVSAAVASDLATKLIGMTYQAYSLQAAIFDPAAEVGDYVRGGANGEVSAVLCAETATLGFAFRADISAPEIGELADEYPYVNFNSQSMQYALNAVQQLDNSLTQQEIFDRLTDGGLTQGISLEEVLTPALGASTPKRIFLNVDYVNEGEMAFSRLRGDVLTLGGANNVNGILRILDANGNVIVEGNLNGLIVNGGSFSSKSLSNDAKMMLNTGALQFYRFDYGVYVPVFELSVSDEPDATGVRMQVRNDGLITDVHNSTGMVFRVYPDENTDDTYIIVTMRENAFFISLIKNGSSIGSFGIDEVNGEGKISVGDGQYIYYGATGSFTANGHTLTIVNGIITDIT